MDRMCFSVVVFLGSFDILHDCLDIQYGPNFD